MKKKRMKAQTAASRDAAAAPVAAIDIGSTSVRMQIAEPVGGDEWNTLESLVFPCSLGADTFRHRLVRPETLREICAILANFRQVMREYGVTDTYAAATSAIREATNQELVVERIQQETGLLIDVLDSVEESRITYQSLAPFLKHNNIGGNAHTLVLDLGGGSTETMVLRGRNLVVAGTRQLGTARLFHTLRGPDSADSQALLDHTIRTAVHSALDLYREFPIRNCIVINSLLVRALANEPGVTPLHRGIEVPAAAIERAVRDASMLPLEEYTRRFPIKVLDAEFLLPSLLVLHECARHLGSESVLIPEIEMLQGLLADIALRRRGISPLLAFREQILRSARSVMDKYKADRPHAQQVAKLSLSLFDALRDFFGLTDFDRLLLELAGLLHDIGMFVGASSHHKHSAYLIEAAELVGLSAEQRRLVSVISRYHRRNTPRMQHQPYALLAVSDRLRVTKLAAILRVADALDRSHRQHIRKLTVVHAETSLELRARADADLIVEENALREKADLLQEISGLDAVLRRQLD